MVAVLSMDCILIEFFGVDCELHAFWKGFRQSICYVDT
jgi:hypothetical protein